MTWENIDKLNPMVQNQTFKGDTETPFVAVPMQLLAREMVTDFYRYVYGSQGEFAILHDYSVYGDRKYPDDIPALSVYGQKMINDYLALNQLSLEDIIEEDKEKQNARYNYSSL